MAVPISNVVRRVVFAPSGVGPYAFTFEILANTDIEVYKGDTLLTLTTDYTVVINANGTGSVTLVVTAGTSNITIVGARTIERTTDFVTGGDLFANSLNEELDSLTIFVQQNSESGDRAIKAPVTDPTTIDMTLPVKTSRAGKYLSFNTSTGDPEVVNTVVDVTAVAANAANINTVAGISANVTSVAGNASNINTVAGISGNVTTVAGIAANVTTVAGISANVTTVAGISADVTTVAGDSADIQLLAANIGTIASKANAGANSDITSLSGLTTPLSVVQGGTGATTSTGSGAVVLATSPTLVTPVLGVATATSVNKVAVTAPATSATLTIADGKTLTASNSLTLAGTDATTMTFPATSTTVAGLGIAQTFTVSQRGTVTTDNDGSFDLSVTNNFQCTPSGTFTLTFTNRTAGQSGFILLINTGGHTVSAHADTEVSTTALATISAAGTYLLSYFATSTNVYVVNSGALS